MLADSPRVIVCSSHDPRTPRQEQYEVSRSSRRQCTGERWVRAASGCGDTLRDGPAHPRTVRSVQPLERRDSVPATRVRHSCLFADDNRRHCPSVPGRLGRAHSAGRSAREFARAPALARNGQNRHRCLFSRPSRHICLRKAPAPEPRRVENLENRAVFEHAGSLWLERQLLQAQCRAVVPPGYSHAV